MGGMTAVFVPQDLAYLGLSVAELRAINPHLVPLIAHDRAGFGGGVCSGGLALFLCIWCSGPTRSVWQALALAGIIGFTTAIAIHPVIGYSNESIEFYVAEGLTHVGAQLDEGEFLDLIIMSLDEMLDALDRGEITDGKTVAALLLYARRRAAQQR